MRAFAVCLIFCMALPVRGDAQNTSHRLAVAPFLAPFNPDYGVFLADRVSYELFAHAYVPALRRTRFVLIETDTLETPLHHAVMEADRVVPEAVCEVLRQRVSANYLLTGSATVSGIYLIHLKLLDLETGEIVWHGQVRDNPSWVWTRANKNPGEIPARDILDRLGFGHLGEVPPPAPDIEELPRNVLLQPLYTTQYSMLSSDCEWRLRESIVRDGLFDLVPGSIKDARGRQRFARLGVALRRQAGETTLADAILCGSLLTMGKNGAIDNMAVVLRLVDVASGRLLWMGIGDGRRVWRWDKLPDIVTGLMASVTEDLAQFGSGAAESALAQLRADAKTGADWAGIGNAYLKKGLLRQAEDAFEKALAFRDVPAIAHDGLGQVYMRRGSEFERAVAAFRTAMSIDPDYLFAYCHLAQTYLDRGMPDGVRIAQQAIARDSTFALAHRVLGDWYAGQENDPLARRHYEIYLKHEPEDIDIAEALGRILLRLGDYAAIDQFVAPILRTKPEATALVPVVAIKARRLRQYSEANRLFARFLGQIDVRERQAYENIGGLLTGAELAEYAGLEGRERQIFEERFWRQKNPDLSSEYNERQLEHFERVWVARRDFGRENFPWDRRGEVYIRYGDPDYRTRSGWGVSLPSSRVREVKERVYRELYRQPPEGEVIGPVFPIRSDHGTGMLDDLAAQDIRGEEIARDRVGGVGPQESREAYAPVTMQQDRSLVAWESWVYTEIEGGLVFDFTREMGGTSGFDFAPIPPAPPSMLRNAIRLAEYAPEIAFQRAIASQPDNFRPARVLALDAFYYDVVDFRGDGRNSRVDVAYGVPLSSLMPATDGRRTLAVIERGLALADSSYTVVYRQNNKVNLDVDTSHSDAHLVIDAIRQDVPPGFYHLSLTLADAMSGRKSQLKRQVRIADYGENGLKLSGLMLVSALSDTVRDVRFRRGMWEAVPNPGRVYRAPQSLAFYCEVYNLKKDTFGQTHYRVTVGIKSVARDRPAPTGLVEQPEVALSYDQVGNQDWERLPMEIDLGRAVTGQNRLVVVLEDLNTGEKVAGETFFDYIR